MTRRQRVVVYGTGAVTAFAAGCYGWHPVLSAAAAFAATLGAAAVVDAWRPR